MHNGSMATLEEVMQSYTRGGNLEPDAKHLGTVFPQVQLRGDARADVIEFLESLTDERVRYERAPFDHPEIFIPHGHAGDQTSSELGHAIDAELSPDEFLHVPAVGASGREAPLLPFDSYLPPCEGGCDDRLAQSGPGAPVPLGPDAPAVCTVPEPSQPCHPALAALLAMSLARRARHRHRS